MKRPEFIQTRPADVERVGLTGAYLLATVRYATHPNNDRDGRERDEDGAVWWRASYATIAALLGLDRDCVISALNRLQQTGELLTRPGTGTNRTKSYRTPSEQSFQDLPTPSEQSFQDLPTPTRSGVCRDGNAFPDVPTPGVCRDGNAPLYTEEKKEEEQEEGGERARVTAPAPPPLSANRLPAKQTNTAAPVPWCPRHPGGTADNCRACMTSRRHYEWWLDNTEDGLAHQQQILARKKLMERDAKPLAREAEFARLRGEHSSEGVTRILGAYDKRREIESGRVVDGEVIDAGGDTAGDVTRRRR